MVLIFFVEIRFSPGVSGWLVKERKMRMFKHTVITVLVMVILPGGVGAGADTDSKCLKQAEVSAGIAGYSLSKVKRWLHEVAIKKIDANTGLYIGDGRWNYRDTAADCYPFLCWAAHVTDIDLLYGPIRDVLDAERKLCNHLDRIPARFDLKKGKKDDSVSYDTLIFGASEYVKDGLIAIVEVTGKADWFDRMKEIEDDVWKHARIETPFGRIPSTNIEVNGEQLQALARLYTMTGNKKYLKWARRLGDYYFSQDDFVPERLRDHGCEIIGGLGLLLAVESELKSDRVEVYKKQLKRIFDTILARGCNEDGMMYNHITKRDGSSGRLSDGWGYNYVGYICYDMIVGEPVYRPHIERTLRNLSKPKYRNYAWEGTSIDGFADSVEGGIYVLNRYPAKEGFDWVDSEVANNIARSADPLDTAELWGTMKLQANGVRTVVMHALMHTQGLIARPWDVGMKLGACPTAGGLVVIVEAAREWEGKIIFDIPRHKHYMGFEKDWPRMNTLPEWFTVELDGTYRITHIRTGKTQDYTGRELHDGLELKLEAAERTTLRIEPI
ncbi:MAG: hypothetical protein CEE38_18525 [Planctomycetes bacterium B3_Pla]|nr:MAG: hypothetical protein CEE38_18525 [Planctomycetes bacterium B3_Pla]